MLRFDRSLQGSGSARKTLAAALFIAVSGFWFPLPDASASGLSTPQSVDQTPTDAGPSPESASVLIGSLGRAFAEDATYVLTSPLRGDKNFLLGWAAPVP